MKDKGIAIVLSFFLGILGMDRFYLGYYGIGLFKLLTFGGFGILYIVDFIRIAIGHLRPKNGEYSAESIQACSNDFRNVLSEALVGKNADQTNGSVMIASAIKRGPYAVAFDAKGNKLFSVAADQVIGFTSNTVTVKLGTWAVTYDEKGNKLYSNALQ